jgi:hypothetical protein
MKGVVFTELLEMVEARFSLAVVDAIITRAAPGSGAQYTSVGTYPAEELVALVRELSAQTSTPVPALLREFGAHLLRRFLVVHPKFFEGAPTAFALLSSVDGYIHVEVRKLYPDAELPQILCVPAGPDVLVLTYRSPRRFADLAEGLITATLDHYGERATIAREDLSQGRGEVVRFTVTRVEPS